MRHEIKTTTLRAVMKIIERTIEDIQPTGSRQRNKIRILRNINRKITRAIASRTKTKKNEQ